MTNRLSLKAVAVLALVMALPASTAAAFDCPVGPPAGDAAQASEITALLGPDAAFDDMGRMQETIDTLIGRGVSRSVILDELIGAYCPTVASEAGLSDAQKAERIRSFAMRIAQIAYAPGGNEEAVILNVPFGTAALAKIKALAAAKGWTPEAWVADLVEANLD